MIKSTAWHSQIDTLFHFSPYQTKGNESLITTDLHIPVGVWSDELYGFNIVLETRINNENSFRIGFNQDNKNGYVKSIFIDELMCLRLQDPMEYCWYVQLIDEINKKRDGVNQYFDAILRNIRLGAKVEYRITALPWAKQSNEIGPFTIFVTNPVFQYDDIFYMNDGDHNSNRHNACALYYKSDDVYHYLRVDFTDLLPDPKLGFRRPDIDLYINSKYFWKLTQDDWNPQGLPSIPYINPFLDYVVVSIPKADLPEISEVIWQGRRLNLRERVNVGKTRLMFIHYCMQGLNDLFELPNKGYSPPRSFIETTMLDEYGTFSSRPNSADIYVGDGYMYTLKAHEKYNIKHLWTFNGGVLILLAHDCSNEVKLISDHIRKGILDPTIAGFGGHRLPYYQLETNTYSIEYGKEILSNILGDCNDVYYLDQRLYKQIPNVSLPLRKCVRYVVVDDVTGYQPYSRDFSRYYYLRSRSNIPGLDGIGDFREISEWAKSYELSHNYLWQDKTTGLYILYIDMQFRDTLFKPSDYEQRRRHFPRELRERFHLIAANPDKFSKRNLIIYSDDADKASGNGWFDGNYDVQKNYVAMFDAALEWLAARPWIECISSADLDPSMDCVGSIDMRTASCPSVDPANRDGLYGVLNSDKYGNLLHFDSWHKKWKEFRSLWLEDKQLEELSQDVEYAIISWPSEYRSRIYELAKMAFSIYLHESQWNKQPLEGNANETDVLDPEDFVLSATLQIRNAQVYLNASVWALWAEETTDDSVYLNNGPILEKLGEIQYSNEIASLDGKYANRRINYDSLRWDRDILRNVILYNRHVLLVMDQNGGRITHVFDIKEKMPRCLSGTFKCHQFITGEKIYKINVPCDGEVIQNNVYTPNHAYVACDVNESRGTIGTKFDERPKVGGELAWYYPDNFNSYKYELEASGAIVWHYHHTGQAQPKYDLKSFKEDMIADRNAKVVALKQGGLDQAPGIVYHDRPEFKKRISLQGKTITIAYKNTKPNHVVANEFCGDLFNGVMHGHRVVMQLISNQIVEFTHNGQIFAKLTLADNCQFTAESQSNRDERRRLSRVLTECAEITTANGGDFIYHIQLV